MKFTSSIPNLPISGITFSCTFVATPFLSWTSSRIPTVPTISLMLPSRTCLTCSIKSSWFIPKVASNALSSNSGSLEIFKLATPSTLMLINSCVGMGSRVLISTWKTFNERRSFLCKKGILQPAFPLNIFLFPRPEIMIASSGPAFVYEQAMKIIIKTTATTPRRIQSHKYFIITSSISLDYLCSIFEGINR